ncbi:MAG: FtsQ-type POTRA domain-containing protein [Ferruginibacter sp.]
MVKKKTIIKWALTSLWISIGLGTVFLLVAGVRKKDAQKCSTVDIYIKGVEKNFFVDKKDVLSNIIQIAGGQPEGRPIASFDLRAMEQALEKNVWIKDAELFFDNNETLQVTVTEREPVARIFTASGNTFYIDSSIARLPLSEKYSARLPVFTSFPSDLIVLSATDSSLLKAIRTMSAVIRKDSFNMALVQQVDITAQRTFEFIPEIGNSIIVFGDATDAEDKFEKLKLFYKNVMPKTGLNYYSTINVQYKGQIVAKRRGAEDIKADSMKTLQLLQLIAANAKKQAEDSVQHFVQDNLNNSTDSSMIQQSVERDIDNEPSNTGDQPVTMTKPVNLNASEKPKPQGPALNRPVNAVTVIKPTVVKPKPLVKTPAAVLHPKPKPVMPKPVTTKPMKTPKATMPKRNDY